MAKHLAIVVNWYGPYTADEVIESARLYYDAGLYLGIGKVKHQKSKRVPQYIGLSKNLATRLANHSKLPEITREVSLWLGEVATAEVAGKKTKKTPPTLDLAEWALAYFMQIPLNDKKRHSPPDRAVTLLNRWWRKDSSGKPWVRRPHEKWPDLIDYVGVDLPAKIVWFGKNLKRIKPPFGSGE